MSTLHFSMQKHLTLKLVLNSRHFVNSAQLLCKKFKSSVFHKNSDFLFFLKEKYLKVFINKDHFQNDITVIFRIYQTHQYSMIGTIQKIKMFEKLREKRSCHPIY